MYSSKANYLKHLYSRIPVKTMVLSQHMEGLTPPSVFVGREGYPKVNIGPMMTTIGDNVSIMDKPEQWSGKAAEDILSFRIQMVRGKYAVKVKDFNTFVQNMQEIALAKHTVNLEAQFTKIPTGHYVDEEVHPYGPSAPIQDVKTGNIKLEHHMEKAYYDTDLLSKDAVIALYKKGLLFSSIQKAFSTGAFGLEKNRKLVPTRWSITAVDDMLGKHLISEIKNYHVIDSFQVYEYEAMHNRFVVLFMPTVWQYEFLEAFIKVFGNEQMLYADWEGHNGRKTYAGMGGCYYSARLAAAEKLRSIKKQAGVLVFRESYRGYVPLGVWLIREHVRAAMKAQPKIFSDYQSAMNYVRTKIDLPYHRYVSSSKMLKNRQI
ncbi:MAG: hypothetical protein NT120_00175 [Candidatus Aenigmarchaeota archaeon]|nr:hypothetical protein [Candidatus Aenigmarchaeota archaeon]